MARKIKVGITHGDINGVGYEIIVKALADERIPELFTPVVFATRQLFEEARGRYGTEMPNVEYVKSASQAKEGRINVVDLRLGELPLNPGVATKESGEAAVAALEAAVEAVKGGEIDLIVTAPINKAAVQSETFHFPGHTEYLEDKCRPQGEEPRREEPKAQMILFDDFLRVALATTHLPVAAIPEAITREMVTDSIVRLEKILKSDFG
ncbi:MAG: 4-hydroxythreonine-4-phosphate dehydrogenase PdxA, partial [Muribaculaceae bacterium]|nr:4-hydroxythreonine-4-phosphate dehydrogenase PdxA [Muribaculaceae bacterium]